VDARWLGTPEARFDAAETASFVGRCLSSRPGRLLDIGCGPGYWLARPGSFGCDLSLPRLREVPAPARKRVVAADWADLPFADGAFDAALLIHAAEYEHRQHGLRALLDEVRRVLMPGGRVCIVTKNPDGVPWRAARRLADRREPCPHPAVARTAADLAALWGAPPLEVCYLSSRMVLSLRDVNDAARGEAPAPIRRSALALARMLAPALRSNGAGRHLAWHVGVCFERPLAGSPAVAEDLVAAATGWSASFPRVGGA
jgi:SAM-dependent methyltransferase